VKQAVNVLGIAVRHFSSRTDVLLLADGRPSTDR
jgi:hypothetical protein